MMPSSFGGPLLAFGPVTRPRVARERPRLVELLAEAAHCMHQAFTSCPVPYDRLEEEVMERARERVASGLVERSWQGTGRAGGDPVRALAEVERRVEQAGPLPETATHGDFCLPNILVGPDGGWGGSWTWVRPVRPTRTGTWPP